MFMFIKCYIKDLITVRDIVVWDTRNPRFRTRVVVRRNKIQDFCRYKGFLCDEKYSIFNEGVRYDIDRTGL